MPEVVCLVVPQQKSGEKCGLGSYMEGRLRRRPAWTASRMIQPGYFGEVCRRVLPADNQQIRDLKGLKGFAPGRVSV